MGDDVKNIKTTLLIVGLIVVGIGSFFIYNRQQENKFLEFEGYEVSIVEKRVEELYNDDKTDLASNLTADKFTEINQLILELEDKEYRPKNQKKLEQVRVDFETASTMHELELSINEMFEEDSEIVKKDTNEENIIELEEQLKVFQDTTKFYTRNSNQLVSASEQVETIKLVQEMLDELFQDGELRDDVTIEQLEGVQQLISTVKNIALRDSLLARLDGIEIASAEDEEPEDEPEEELEEVDDDADEEAVEVVREPEREREREPEPEPETTTPSRPSTPTAREPETEPKPKPASPTKPTKPDVVNVTEQKGNTIEIPFETTRNNNAALSEGQEAIVQYGKPGQAVEVYEVTTYSDGTETRKKLRTEIIRNPENRIVQVGTAPAPSEEQ